MAVREFTDGRGVAWRVWDVAPDELNARTRDEDFLARLYLTGWIVFETITGSEKRRLYPIPKGWVELPDAQLEVLLQKAEVVPPRKLRAGREATGPAAVREIDRAHELLERVVENAGVAHDEIRDETPDVTDLRVVRTFRYPGGRIWTACVMPGPQAGHPHVLRFSAGARSIDLADWPKDWIDYPDSGLVDLLRRAAPRPPAGQAAPGTPQRRHDDGAAPR